LLTSLLIAMLVPFQGACSFIVLKPTPGARAVDCTSSRVAPAVDTAAAAASLLGVIASAVILSQPNTPPCQGDPLGCALGGPLIATSNGVRQGAGVAGLLMFVPLTLGFSISAAVGFNKTDRCAASQAHGEAEAFSSR
jgi:hypothetical protein